MNRFKRAAYGLRIRFFPAMTKEQAELLVSVKFPCR